MSPKLNTAIAKNHFRKVERIIKHEIKKHKQGVEFDNGPGSGMQITHAPTFDSLVIWLKKHPNVEDAAWDRCAEKIAIYPGWAVLGARFKTKNGVREMCFHVQQGTMTRLKVRNGKAQNFPALDKNILVYRKMYACEGFIEQQKQNCARQ